MVRPTLASFTDEASVAASFAVAATSGDDMVVSIAGDATQIIALRGATTYVRDLSTSGWEQANDAPFSPTQAAACDDGFLVTDGRNWASWRPGAGWQPQPAPFALTTVLAGTTTCVASDGTVWAVTADGGATWTPRETGPDGPRAPVAASQSDGVVLASDGDQLWYSRDLARSWSKAANPPPRDPGPLLVEDELVYAAGRWYGASNGQGGPADLDNWAVDEWLSSIDLADPIASGSDAAGRRLLTNGTSWLLVSRTTDHVVPFPAPPT